MTVIKDNCKRCPEFEAGSCDGNVNDCMCKNCPRNLGECIITRYCRETESVIFDDSQY